MSIEHRFIDAINANHDDRTLQLVYADWLDEQGDPRAEAWRVLIEAGKRPSNSRGRWDWWYILQEKPESSRLAGLFPEVRSRFNDVVIPVMNDAVIPVIDQSFPTFHAAMNAAAIAWVRCHRDADFEPDELTERV